MKLKLKYKNLISIALLLIPITSIAATEWAAVSDESELAKLFTDTTMVATLKDDVTAEAKYYADGTGELNAWGDIFKREWKIENQQACLKKNKTWQCFNIAKQGNQYRAIDTTTNEQVIFTVNGQKINSTAVNKTSTGGAAAPSAEELAKTLANPNTPLASLNFRLQQRQFEGTTANADSQSSTTLLFQPSMPFTLDNGDMVFFRPGIPLLIGQPVFDGSTGNFESETGLGDIGFDIAYGITTKTGWAFATGLAGSLPTATVDGMGTDKFSVGPELLVAKLGKDYVLGAYPNHMWDVAGSGNTDVSVTNAQLFAIWLPGGGWNVGSTPILSYDHINKQATIPVNLTVGKTIIFDGTPWKLGVEFNYYVEKSDTIGATWMIGFNLGPVVKNVVAEWLQ